MSITKYSTSLEGNLIYSCGNKRGYQGSELELPELAI